MHHRQTRHARRTRLAVPLLSLLAIAAGAPRPAFASGDAATKFNVFVPADAMSSRRSYLVVTNVSPEPAVVDIVDDNADGDSDDSVLGVALATGESYVVRLADGAVNDDYGGKNDGDYFKIRANHPVIAMMGNASSWEHDWVPSEGGARGTSFFTFSLPTSGSKSDLNVFSYADGTKVSVSDVSTNVVTATGKATANIDAAVPLFTTTLNAGEDLNVRKHGLGIDALTAGHTYWVRADKPVTMITGHLNSLSGGNQARDGGGFVPSANGSTNGSLFYLTIPHETGKPSEKELRVVCPTAGSTVRLFGANADSPDWGDISVDVLQNAGQHLDFVGASNPLFQSYDLYKLTVSPPQQGCSLYEANWMETGSYGTSDSASAVSSDEGTGLGTGFSIYLGPPGLSYMNEPAGEARNIGFGSGSYGSRLYVYGTQEGTTVTVKDLDTDGAIVQSSFTVGADSYYHFVVPTTAYDALRTAGRRPYVRVTASAPVSIVSGNFNDNWLTYFQSVVPPEPKASVATGTNTLSCGQQTTISVTCDNTNGSSLSGLTAALTLPPGVALVAGSASDAIASTQGATTSWSLGALAGGTSRTVTVDVTLDCASLGCAPADLAAIRAECSGTNGGELYARVASANVSLVDDSKATVTGLTAVDDASDPAAPFIRASYTLSGGSGAATATLTRAIGDASPNATQVALATDGAGTHTFEDDYAQSYQQTYFYRVSVTDGACTRSFGPLPVETSSGQSSGFDGGLESNGRLASALARRALARATNASWLPTAAATSGRSVLPTAAEALPFGLGAMAARSWDGTLRGAIPAEGPGASHAVDVTPGDLPALTNAGQVASADYVDARGRRVGTVLAVETLGTTYEHGKAICDRASGSTLDGVEATALESGATLLRASLRDGKGRTGDVATEFKIYANPDGSREAYASWLRDGYPAPRADQRVINVQAWSAIPGYELALADAILAGTGATLREGAASPAAFVTRAGSLGGAISADVGGAAAGLHVRTTRLLEDGTTATELAPLTGGRFSARVAKTLETTLDLVDSSGKTVDRVWLSDGAWALLDDAVVGGATGSATVETTGCRRTTPTLDSDLALAGCAHFSGEVRGLAGVARNLARAVAPLDLRDYEGISFTYASNLPVRACLEQAGRAASAQPCVTLAPSATTTVSLPLSAFAAESDACATTPKVGLTAVTFVAATGTGTTSLALAVDELTLHRAAPDAASVLAASPCLSNASDPPSTPGTVPATGDTFATEASCAVTPNAASGGPGIFGALVAALAALVGVGGRKRRA
jgi:hypothetical protein